MQKDKELYNSITPYHNLHIDSITEWITPPKWPILCRMGRLTLCIHITILPNAPLEHIIFYVLVYKKVTELGYFWLAQLKWAKYAVLTYKCIRGTAPTYLADELLQPADLGIRTRLRLALTTACPSYMTVIYWRPSLSPLPAPGTTCRAMSQLHHPCLFFEAVWRCTSSGVLSRNFC